MIGHTTIDIAAQRMRETQQAILEQRKYVASLSDPVLKAIALRTLTTLEDILLIMERTRGILVVTASDPDPRTAAVTEQKPSFEHSL